jgi:hypothetical protein
MLADLARHGKRRHDLAGRGQGERTIPASTRPASAAQAVA